MSTSTVPKRQPQQQKQQQQTPSPRQQKQQQQQQQQRGNEKQQQQQQKQTTKPPPARQQDDESPDGQKWKRYQEKVTGELCLEKLRVAVIQRKGTQLEEALGMCEGAGLESTETYKDGQLQLEAIKLSRELKEACDAKDASHIQSTLDDIRQHGLDHQLRNDIIHATFVLCKLTSRHGAKGRSAPLTMDRNTVCEIRRLQKPPASLRSVMQAVLLLFGHDEQETASWRTVQKLCNPSSETGLYRSLLVFDNSQVHVDIAARVRQLLDAVDIDKLKATSAGAASFYVWAMSVIEDVEQSSDAKDAQPAMIGRQKEIFAQQRFARQCKGSSPDRKRQNGRKTGRQDSLNTADSDY